MSAEEITEHEGDIKSNFTWNNPEKPGKRVNEREELRMNS